MRLINVDTLMMHVFNEADTPPYVILSHMWVDGEEVTYQEMATQLPATTSKSGYTKIRNCAQEAQRLGLNWIWIDTCCIDKTNNAALSEAINSMYAYYKNSEICLAYLRDVSMSEHVDNLLKDYADPLKRILVYQNRVFDIIRGSRWFTRGWTLQELIAPSRLNFYTVDWTLLTDRNAISQQLAEHTNILAEVLEGFDASIASVAQRMSWAAGRETTRTEDLAYCLLGIFDISMPLIYGEGAQAFRRLQEEIIKYSTDQTLLSWYLNGHSSNSSFTFPSVLAPSPSAFEACATMRELDHNSWSGSAAYSLSSTGLTITLPLAKGLGKTAYTAFLNCTSKENSIVRAELHLEKLENGTYVKTCRPSSTPFYNNAQLTTMIIFHRNIPRYALSQLSQADGIIFKHPSKRLHMYLHSESREVTGAIRRMAPDSVYAPFPVHRPSLKTHSLWAAVSLPRAEETTPWEHRGEAITNAIYLRISFKQGKDGDELFVGTNVTIRHDYPDSRLTRNDERYQSLFALFDAREFPAQADRWQQLPTNWEFTNVPITTYARSRKDGYWTYYQTHSHLPLRARALLLDGRLGHSYIRNHISL